MPDSVGAGGFPRNINIGHEHLDLSSGFTYQYQGGVPTDILNWKIINGVSATDPSPLGWGTKQLGAMWFNSSLGVFRYWDGVSVKSFQNTPPLYDYRNSIYLQDDFVTGASFGGGIGTLGWFIAGGTLTVGSDDDAPGWVQRLTGTTPSTVTYLILSGNQNNFSALATKSVLFRVRGDSDAEVRARIGMSNSFTSATPGTGAYFEKLEADTNWFAVNRNNNVETRVDTGILASDIMPSFAYYKIDTSASSSLFYVNGNLVATVLTNLPVAARTTPGVQIVNAAANSKSLTVDYFELAVTEFSR